MKNKKLIVANWKLHPTSLPEAKKLFLAVKKTARGLRNVQTVLCPPSVYISELSKLYKGHRILLGSQDLFWENKGAYTGQVSPLSLKGFGVEYSIIGHSEKRALGESNEVVNKKVVAAVKAGLQVILCIGESGRDPQASYLQFLKEEVESALVGIGKTNLKKITIAYEPIWAIGKSTEDAMSPHQMHEVYLFIRKILVELFDKKSALEVSIIYGGSAEPGNVKELLSYGEIDGFLVGHASLKASEFNKILEIANL